MNRNCIDLFRKGEEPRERMVNKVATISDLIHRVACSCLVHHHLPGSNNMPDSNDDDDIKRRHTPEETTDDSDHQSSSSPPSKGTSGEIWEEEEKAALATVTARAKEMEALTSEVFESVSSVKKAYVSLQQAHSPWDPDKMRAADAAVVAELRRLGRLRDRFRRSGAGPTAAAVTPPPVREVVAPYEAAIEELKREVRERELEVEGLKERLRAALVAGTPRGSAGRKGRAHCGLGAPAAPTPELFVSCTEEVKSASRSLTAHLLSLMRSARWDIAAAARSIVANCNGGDETTAHLTIPTAVDPRHAKHALESYLTRKIFHGFENETFYIDGSLTSLLRPSEFRRDCFAQFRDMRRMDPAEILGILPTCAFGKFAAKKYLSMVHAEMEESLFGGAEQRRQVLAGAHPRTGFYGDYLRLAKAVWMLHLLAFAMDPAPSHFEASKGAEFHREYMESVVRLGAAEGGLVVGFPVAPGFKLGNGSVIRTRVYLVPKV